jgi:DNA-binding transcriptional ArsR family regulator
MGKSKLAESRRPHFPTMDESLNMERIDKLRPFDRAMLRFGRVLATTGGVTLKSPTKGTVVTSVDIAVSHLQKIGAKDFDSGQSASQVAKATGYKRFTMSGALNELVKRGIVKSEQRGRQIRYFLPA